MFKIVKIEVTGGGSFETATPNREKMRKKKKKKKKNYSLHSTILLKKNQWFSKTEQNLYEQKRNEKHEERKVSSFLNLAVWPTA